MQQIQAGNNAFAALLGDGSAVTWGLCMDAGDSSSVANKLKNVKQIQAAYAAFAAILGDGSVVTWSNCDYGGNNSRFQDQLKLHKQLSSVKEEWTA